jgi:hypothetical protein
MLSVIMLNVVILIVMKSSTSTFQFTSKALLLSLSNGDFAVVVVLLGVV